MLKRKVTSILDRPIDEAVPIAPDSDFEEDCAPKSKAPRAAGPVLPSNPTAKPTPKPKPPKRTSRLQACSQKDMDRAACAAEDNGVNVKVVFFHLSVGAHCDGIDGNGHHHVTCVDRRGARYDLYPHYEKDQTTLGEAEFIGFFYSGDVDAPGVAAEIIDVLEQNKHVHVVIVDKKGTNFCRLLAGIVVAKMKRRNAMAAAALANGLLRPIEKCWKDALDRIKKAKTEILLRQVAREIYETLA